VIARACGAARIDVLERAVAHRQRDRDALDDVDPQRVGNFLFDGDALDPGERMQVVLHARDVDLEEVQADVALRDRFDGGALRVHRSRDLDGVLLDRPPLYVTEGEPAVAETIVAGPRIGVDYAGEWAQRPWRFFDRASAHVSTAAARRRSRRSAAPAGAGN